MSSVSEFSQLVPESPKKPESAPVQIGPPHEPVCFLFDWLVKENGVDVCTIQAVSRDSALHNATIKLMDERGLVCTKYINGDYSILRKTLTAEKIDASKNSSL